MLYTIADTRTLHLTLQAAHILDQDGSDDWLGLISSMFYNPNIMFITKKLSIKSVAVCMKYV